MKVEVFDREQMKEVVPNIRFKIRSFLMKTRIRKDKLLVKWGFKVNLNKNYVFNPMKKFPPNLNCWCGSKMKAKWCCLPKQKQFTTRELAPTLDAFVKRVRAGQ